MASDGAQHNVQHDAAPYSLNLGDAARHFQNMQIVSSIETYELFHVYPSKAITPTLIPTRTRSRGTEGLPELSVLKSSVGNGNETFDSADI